MAAGARAGHLLRPRSGAGRVQLGAMIRWLDFNDTWLAAEWGHPSYNLGAILPVPTGCRAAPSPRTSR